MPAPETQVDEDLVVLKPIFGVKPGVYLTVLYAVALVLILFFLLVFPGIVRNGAVVSFTSQPAGASILVDGIRIGATPDTAFVTSGKHELTIRKPYFKTSTETIAVPGRLFLSLFAPARLKYASSLSILSPGELISNASRQFASWALIGEAHGQYQFPPVLTDAVTDLYADRASNQSNGPDEASHLLNNALLNVQSSSLLRDFVHATVLDHSAGQVAGPLQFGALFTKIIQLEKQSQGFPLWLNEVLPADVVSTLKSSAWYASFMKNYQESMRLSAADRQTTSIPGPNSLTLDGIQFVKVPGGSFIMGMDEASRTSTDPLLVPSKVRVGGFYMMSTETSRAMFEQFLKNDPKWLPSQRAQLEAQGLVTAGYLAGWSDQGAATAPPAGSANLPVTGVSFGAAQAFASWLTARLPASLSSYAVRLPTEAEWEYAARLSGGTPKNDVFQDTFQGVSREPEPVGTGGGGNLGIHDLMGNVWEWTASWYRPAEPPLARIGATGDNADMGIALSDATAAALPDVHMTVKGGSFANRSDTVSPGTRGSMPPAWCTPYLGFRVIIAPRL